MSMVFPKSVSFHLDPHAEISSGNAILNALWEKTADKSFKQSHVTASVLRVLNFIADQNCFTVEPVF